MAMTNEHDALEPAFRGGYDDGDARDFFALLKPRVMSLVVFTAFVGMLSGARQIHPVSRLCRHFVRSPSARRIRRAQHVVRCRYRPA
jgi:heme O synthase-like polyprenyltransferase